MRRLRLYKRPPTTPVEVEDPRDVDRTCTRCPMHEGARSVCLSADGEAGGLLIVGESPGRTEDAVGRPFVGESGKLLRERLSAWWKGPVCIDNALRCCPGKREVDVKHIAACRGFLARTVREANPTRIVSLGAWASFALTGRSIPPIGSRRAYCYLYDVGEDPVPVFFVLHPASALRNRFIRAWFFEDLQWALTCEPPKPAPVLAMVRVVETVDDAEAAVAELSKATCAFDVETAGVLWERSFRLHCVSVCAEGSASAWSWDREALLRPELVAPLARYLADEDAPKLGQNVKFDENAVFATLGVRVRGVRGDTRLWRRLVDPEAGAKLDQMAEIVGMGGMKEEARDEMKTIVDRVKRGLSAERLLLKRAKDPTKKWPKLQKAAEEGLRVLADIELSDPDLLPVIRSYPTEWEKWAYGLVDVETLVRYNGRDSVATARLAPNLRERLTEDADLDRIRADIVDRAASAIGHVERWGVAADKGAIVAFDVYLRTKMAEVRRRLDAYGKDFNPDSPTQVATLLFETLKIRPPKMTDSGKASTDKEVLAKLAAKHPIAKDLSDWRRFSKLRGTYAGSGEGEGMWTHVRTDGRIHTSILLDGAGTGRTSSQDPNLQNIPRSTTAEGKMARDIFVASPGFMLLQLDYSQLELRVAAMLSGDPEMRAIFESGADYHQRTAELIANVAWGLRPDQLTKEHRAIAKTINFALLYGAGDAKIAEQIRTQSGVSISSDAVERIRTAILGRFRRLSAFIDGCLAKTRKTGVARTWWNGKPARIRPLYKIADADDEGRSVAEHSSWNTPIQGTGSDFLIASLATLVEWIVDEGIEDRVKLVLPVHDSVMFEVREDLVARVSDVAREVMTSHFSDGVPLVVDTDVGRSWGSLAKIEAPKT